MDYIANFLPWWGENANFFPFIFEHWIIVWLISIIINSYLMGRMGMTSGGDDEVFALVVLVLCLPLVISLAILFAPVIAMLVFLVYLSVAFFNLGERGRIK